MITARVSQISKGKLRIQNISKQLRGSLMAKGISIVPDGLGFPAIEFKANDKSLLENDEFIELVKILVIEGVAFCRDYKEAFPPSYAVEELKNSGFISDKITICGYDGKKWLYEQK